MTLFPNGPTSGDQVAFNDTTFEWNGTRWVALGSISVGPTGPAGATGATGPVGDYVETFNGVTGTVDTSALTLHVAGISSDGGITASRLISTDAGSQSAGSVVVGGIHHIFSNGSNLQFAPNGFSKFSMSGSEVGAFAPFKTYSTSILSGKVNTQAGISMDTAGITFPDGTYQSTAATSITDYVSSFNGVTGTVDTSSLTLHVAGISSDAGITAAGNIVSSAEIQSNEFHAKDYAGKMVFNGSGGGGLILYASTARHINMGLHGVKVEVVPFTVEWSSSKKFEVALDTTTTYNQLVTEAGISMDTAGITFPDGTYQSTAATEFTSSHTALLEFPDNKSYSLDSYTIANRTYNFLYGISATGGCSADLVAGGSTLGSISITPSGASASFSSSVSSGTEVSIVISGVTGGVYLEDVRLVAGYTQ